MVFIGCRQQSPIATAKCRALRPSRTQLRWKLKLEVELKSELKLELKVELTLALALELATLAVRSLQPEACSKDVSIDSSRLLESSSTLDHSLTTELSYVDTLNG